VLANKADLLGAPPPELRVERAVARSLGAVAFECIAATDSASVAAFVETTLCAHLLRHRERLENGVRTRHPPQYARANACVTVRASSDEMPLRGTSGSGGVGGGAPVGGFGGRAPGGATAHDSGCAC